MDTGQILILLLLFLAAWYWLDSLHIKHLASDAGRQECDRANLEFLDDTVVLRKIRLSRDKSGRVQIKRKYRFEFTSDEHNRYTGDITMLGKRVQHIALEPYRLP